MPATVTRTDANAAFTLEMEAALIERIGRPRYQLWFAEHTRFIRGVNEVIVGVGTVQLQEWLEQTFGHVLRDAVQVVCQMEIRVRFLVDEELFGETTKVVEPEPEVRTKETVQRTLFGTESLPPSPRKPNSMKTKSKPRSGRRLKSLDDFVVGASNRLAHAAALSVVEDPAQGVNPLVIHGPVGTGKTHLLEGIMAGLRNAEGERPNFVTAEEFTTRFVQSTRFGKQSAFRRQFRECSALLLDDLNFLATKRATQEEFLHTFDSLLADDCQIVVTMDCHPRLAEELMPELVDRLLGGAVWGVLPPDDETRLSILKRRAGQATPIIPEPVLKYLARNLKGNVRELEGAVHSVRHFSKVTGRAITTALVREALGDLLRHTVRAISVGDVDSAVCTVLKLNHGTLQSKARTWAVSHPRMLAIYLARKHSAATYGEIAKHFNVKTHSTATAAEKRVREWMKKDDRLALGDREWPVKELLDRVERELLR